MPYSGWRNTLKLVSFEFHGEQRLGALVSLGVVDLARAHELFPTESAGMHENEPIHFPQRMIDFLEIGQDISSYTMDLMNRVHVLLAKRSNELQQQKVLLNITDLRILPPVPVPRKIICLGLNYRDHAEEAHVAVPDRPVIFSKPSTAIVGPEDPVIYPRISAQVDYEVELAAVIGKRCKNASESDAFDHVAGYTVLNDVSARDIQFADKQWFRGKSFDTFAPTGPCLVLREQLSDPHNLEMQLRVNGEVRQRSSTANMIFKIPQLVAFISEVMTLEAGDIIATGTPAGVGFYARPEKRLLKPGDVMEAEIEGIGVLRNRIVSAECTDHACDPDC
jgi:2-keto-4-pentenoate hydratase/2-oxohepta-3-ene-1,7-dioic acid hydratase in catechol pathway